jgi:hypothetical protein
VASEVVTTRTPGDEEHPEEPTERAGLRIRTCPLDITVSAQGAATRSLAVGVIGPAVTIVVGHFVGLAVWAVIVICALQVAVATVAVVHRRN